MRQKSLWLLIMSMCLLLIGILPASAQGRVVTIQQNVNIRTAPDANAERLGTVRAGTAFNIDGRNESGEWIRGITERGTVGWIVSGPTGLTINEIIGIPIITPDTPFTLSPPAATSPQPAAPAPASEDDSAAPAPIVANTAPIRGFSYGGHVASYDENAFNWMRTAGMTWIKKQVRYGDGQNPENVRGLIEGAHAAGFRILLGVVGYPDEINNNGYFERYAGFVGGVAAIGADAIEVWNEPNIDHEWPAGQIDPARYTELLRQSYISIKNNNPNTMVISAAPAPTGAEAAFPGRVMNDDNYLAGMAAAGAANYMDCLGAHYNEGIVPPTATSGDPRGNSGYYTRYLPSMISRYTAVFGRSKPICFTELGYLTPEGYGPLSGGFAWAENTSLAEQAAWVDGAVSYASRTGRVRLVIIWNINFTNYGADPMAGFAIMRPGNICPACEALGR
jgi:hypothetical protein